MGRKPAPKQLTHLDSRGRARMVDVSAKPVSSRTAEAAGFIHLQPDTLAAVISGETPKGDVLATARLAGIAAAKHTATLIPLCHPLSLSWVDVDFEGRDDGIAISSIVKARETTGLEMEALTAVSVAALTIYDMCKAIDGQMRIGDIRLVHKEGGSSALQPAYRPRTAIIVVSDSTFAGRRQDRSGEILRDGFDRAGCQVEPVQVVPDEPDQLRAAARDLLDKGAELLITSGGTGQGPRDVTIPTMEPLLGDRLPGIEQALHAAGRVQTSTAMLSRLAVGINEGRIIVCLPGSSGAARDALQVLIPAVFHAFEMQQGEGHTD
ncbi:MAG: bifunctional molybdenum cofactor biosynthesis protein MoaC/MoaB [Candidatus Neomarinimicrobiota bacterium]